MKSEPITYEIIEKAVLGDTDMMCKILDHFSGLICKLSMVHIVGENGTRKSEPDEDIMRELEIELIQQLPKFRLVDG